jgi:DNA polymerase III subunit epsilon
MVMRRLKGIDPLASFVAIDFETANRRFDSACAVGLVRVERREMVRRETWLLRPPSNHFRFTRVHGITWERVSGALPFREVWPALAALLAGAEFVAAHNADFDRGVLHACCRAAGVRPPGLPFLCSMRLARRTWGICPTTLPEVCRFLGLPVLHHDAGADAEACAHIVMRALEKTGRGWQAGSRTVRRLP